MDLVKKGMNTKRCEFCILSLIVSFLGILGTAGLFLRVLKKVMTGHGLDYYTTFYGIQFSYIGALVTFIVMAIGLVLAPLIYWFDPISREERNFKEKYKISDK
jgi:hypothetical protein